MENLEISDNLTAASEMSCILPKDSCEPCINLSTYYFFGNIFCSICNEVNNTHELMHQQNIDLDVLPQQFS